MDRDRQSVLIGMKERQIISNYKLVLAHEKLRMNKGERKTVTVNL